MNKVKTLDDLRKMRETLRSTLDIREKKVIILNKWYRSGYLWQLAGLPPEPKDHELFH